MIISQYICILYIYIYILLYHPRIKLEHQQWFRSRWSIGSIKISASEIGVYPKITIFTGEYEWISRFPYFLKAYSITIYIHISRILDFSDDFSIWSQMISDLEFIWSSKTWCQKLQRPCHQRLHFLPRCTLAFGRLSRDGRVWRWIARREIPQKWRFLAEKIIYKYSNIPSGKHTKSYWKWP